ncbi:hypothetical protein J4217_04460 [Candidatus Pacearchaeota archaeon]|nr:hypothetical protein [Candidatus Pacearchaeota archaeon]
MKKQVQSKDKEKDYSIRLLFLRELIRNIILANYQNIIEEERLEKKVYAFLKEEKPLVRTQVGRQLIKPIPVQIKQLIRPAQFRPMQRIQPKQGFQKGIPVPRTGGQPPIEFVQSAKISKESKNNSYQESIITPLTNLGFGKILPILQDRFVQSIECPGPGKPLIINKSGIIQTSPINLSTEEIMQIMKDISDKTKIPLLTGAFKAAFDRYVMTAVISDYVGTRFVIQRKLNPDQFE